MSHNSLVRHFLPIILLLLVFGNLHSQTIPVGTPLLESYYRRAQLMGTIDSTISFCVNPFNPTTHISYLISHVSYLNSHISSPKSPKSPLIRLLPITWKQQINTNHPYSLNDGPMIPARGYQTILTGGFFAKLSILSIQVQPELVYAQNRDFDTFTDIPHSEEAINAYNGFHSSIDLPEYFPETPYKRIFPGQSSIRLTAWALSAGLSSENLWWGPGTRNALMMSNSSPGFYHFTLNTVKPIRTPIGTFEGQIIGGKLETSNFLGKDQNGTPVYYPEPDDWRYLNAMVFTWQPRWVHGLFLGFTRSFMLMNQDAKDNHRYLPVISPFSKKEAYGDGELSFPEDQQLTLFARWIWPADHAEIYAEYGRGDHNYDLRDMYLEPDHFRAYILGFKKLFYKENAGGKYVEFNLELTQLEQNKTNEKRAASYFSAYAAPLRGNTNLGQMLGAGIGTGSNMQTISLAWGKGLNKLGFQVERYVHNNDLYYQFSNDNRGHWVDMNLAFIGERSWKNLLFSAKLEGIRSYNYQHNYEQANTDTNNYWAPGEDRYNIQGIFSVSYLF